MIKVTIIVAMYNIAETLEKTLQSISEQTYQHWEALLIDDGSTDATLEIAQGFAQKDDRFRIIQVNHSGVSEARNRGLAEAKYDWTLFLDGDDWILPKHLELMTAVLNNDPQLGAVYCGWCWYSPDDYYFFKDIGRDKGDLFPLHAVECPFAIHAYLVKTEILREVGGFDPTLATCEDWDLWQRVSRAGTLFGRVPQILAPARMRAGSASMDGRRILEDGLKVLEQGHKSDWRLAKQHPKYVAGLPDEDLTSKKYYLLCSAAGLLIGRGEDPSYLLELLDEERWLGWDPLAIAECITLAALLSASQPLKQWSEIWPPMIEKTLTFLRNLEKHSSAVGMADRVIRYPARITRIYMGDTGGLNRVMASFYKKTLLYPRAKSWGKRQAWIVIHYVKRHVESTLKLNGSLYRLAHRVNRRLFPSEDTHFFEDLFDQEVDPWGYTSEYEQKKYEQTLEIIPDIEIDNALELACAEGHFTVQLAPRVKNLLATDVSEIALKRCAERCSEHQNIQYQRLDLVSEKIDGRYQLMICSEVLYYAGSRKRLRKIAQKMANSILPDGYLVMVHGNVVIDDVHKTGFNWEHSFGAKGIGETFSSLPNLTFLKEIQTPLYRVQLFQKAPEKSPVNGNTAPEIIQMAQPTELDPFISSQVLWHGCTDEFPTLLYHSVSPNAVGALDEYRVTPENFEAQLRYLRDEGFVSITIDDCLSWLNESTPIPAEAILITFDDGYSDFKEYAWPLLKKYGFSAHVFLVSDLIGKTNLWDREFGEEIKLMDWEDIRELQAEGVTFGAHTRTHPILTNLPMRDAVKQLEDSRSLLEKNLDISIKNMAYPYGEFNRRIMYLTGFCQYQLAFTSEPGRINKHHAPLALPRIEIGGADTDITFAAKVGKGPVKTPVPLLADSQ